MILLETERLLLEKPERDCPYLGEMFNDQEIMALIHPGGYSKEKVKEILEVIAMWWEESAFGPCLLRSKKNKEVVGCNGVKLIPLDGETEKVLDLGYMLYPQFRGQGFVHESSVALLDFAQAKGFSRIVAHPHYQNRASQKILEKLGFSKIRSVKSSFDNSDGYELWELIFESDA